MFLRPTCATKTPPSSESFGTRRRGVLMRHGRSHARSGKEQTACLEFNEVDYSKLTLFNAVLDCAVIGRSSLKRRMSKSPYAKMCGPRPGTDNLQTIHRVCFLSCIYGPKFMCSCREFTCYMIIMRSNQYPGNIPNGPADATRRAKIVCGKTGSRLKTSLDQLHLVPGCGTGIIRGGLLRLGLHGTVTSGLTSLP